MSKCFLIGWAFVVVVVVVFLFFSFYDTLFCDVSSGFQSQSGQSYLHLAKAYVVYIP